MNQDNKYMNLIVTLILTAISLILTVISSFKINGDIDSVWICIMVFGAFCCMLFSVKGVLLTNEIQRIININSRLRALHYSEDEIKERQKYLNSLSEYKLEKLKSKLEYESNNINEDNFFDPLNKTYEDKG
ncbi:hypothetical protein ACWEUB_12825 [Staphylococcus xylosus]